MFYLILALRAVGPFIYCLLVGCSFAIILKKSFTVSLPVAFCTQIVIMMLTGMLFNSVNLGIWVFVAFCTIAGIIRLFNCGFKASFNSFTPNQVALFTATYFAVYVLNYAKCFDSWDEFSHWGHFVKETLRLDALFCTSPLKFAHKDYVPAISLF